MQDVDTLYGGTPLEIPGPRDLGGKANKYEIIREIGQCKMTRQKDINQTTYDMERKKSAGPNDIFILYSQSNVSKDFVLPDRSGLVDGLCWKDYLGIFSGRAYMAYNSSGKVEN